MHREESLLFLILWKGTGVFCLIFCGMGLVNFPSYYRSEIAFDANTILTTGIVVKTVVKKSERITFDSSAIAIGSGSLSGSSSYGSYDIPSHGMDSMPLRDSTSTKTEYISTVKFRTRQGRLVGFVTSSACWSTKDCKNKPVQVQYDPRSPNQARIYTSITERVTKYILPHLFFFLFGLGLLDFHHYSGLSRILSRIRFKNQIKNSGSFRRMY